MARERSLLERLDHADDQGGRRLRVDVEQEADSVLRHLQKMLNVRQGSVPTLPMYGMPDFNDLAARFPAAIVEIQRAIKTSIELYEPRLQRVRVRHIMDDEDPFNLRFEITAHLITGGDNPPIWFESTMNTAGKVSIRG